MPGKQPSLLGWRRLAGQFCFSACSAALRPDPPDLHRSSQAFAAGKRACRRITVSTPGLGSIGSLPPELLCHIFKRLSLMDKMAAERVCKLWANQLKSSKVCPEICKTYARFLLRPVVRPGQATPAKQGSCSHPFVQHRSHLWFGKPSFNRTLIKYTLIKYAQAEEGPCSLRSL